MDNRATCLSSSQLTRDRQIGLDMNFPSDPSLTASLPRVLSVCGGNVHHIQENIFDVKASCHMLAILDNLDDMMCRAGS